MVVIEHEKPDDRNPNQSNSTAAGTDAFDGFETASEHMMLDVQYQF
jgi:hypothetical protein